MSAAAKHADLADELLDAALRALQSGRVDAGVELVKDARVALRKVK